MTEAYKGSCLCSAVTFEVDELDRRAAHCHCSMCRKFHGAEYATFVEVPSSSFQWTKGQEVIVEYRAPNGTVRSFCGRCGSSILFRGSSSEVQSVEVALAAFDTDVPVVPDAHIYVGSAVGWSSIVDDLPQYVEDRGGARVER